MEALCLSRAPEQQGVLFMEALRQMLSENPEGFSLLAGQFHAWPTKKPTAMWRYRNKKAKKERRQWESTGGKLLLKFLRDSLRERLPLMNETKRRQCMEALAWMCDAHPNGFMLLRRYCSGKTREVLRRVALYDDMRRVK